jgi:hypothetical protein
METAGHCLRRGTEEAKSRLSEWTLFYIAYLVVVVFFAVEVSQRSPCAGESTARADRVPSARGTRLRWPRLGDALGARVTLREVWQCSGRNEMAWVPAAIALIAISILPIHKWW